MIVKVSLIATKDFRNKSDKISEKRTSDKRRLVKTM